MPDVVPISRVRQWVWATVLLCVLVGGLLLTYLLRNTEFVNPEIVQRKWIEWRQHR